MIVEVWKLYGKKAIVYTRPEALGELACGAGSVRSLNLRGLFRPFPFSPRGVGDIILRCRRQIRVSQKLWLKYYQHRVSAYPYPISAIVILLESNAMRTRVTFYNKLSLTIESTTYASSHGTFRTRTLCRPSTSTSSPNYTSSGWRRSPSSLCRKTCSTTTNKKPGTAHNILARLRRFKKSLEFTSLR